MTDPMPPLPSTSDAPAPQAAGSVRCRWPALVVGVVLSLGLAALAPVLDVWFGSGKGVPEIFGGYLPALPLGCAVLLAWVWNPVVRFTRLSALALKPWELLCIVGLLFVTVGVTGSSLSGPWSSRLLAKPALERTASAKPLSDGLAPQLSVPYRADDPAVAPLYDGLTSGGSGKPMPIGPLVQPTLWSGALVVLGLLLISGLGAMTARQWTHHERLQHPLAQVPQALVDPQILRDVGFRTALLATLGLWLWNLMAGWGWNPLPRIATEFTLPGVGDIFGASAPGKWVTGMFWASIKIYPAAIGIAFLLTLDLGFSVWGGFWFGVLAFGLLALTGSGVSFEADGRYLGAGATLGMAALILFTGRQHYWSLLKAAIGRYRVDDDRAGVWGVRVVLVAMIGIAVLVWHIGGGTGAAAAGGVLAVVLVSAFVLVIARVVAECGLTNFQSAHEMTLVATSLGLPVLLPYQVFTTLIFLGQTLVMDTRENVSGMMVQGAALGERQGLSPGRLHLGFGAMAIIAAIVALVATFAAAWSQNGMAVSTNMLQVQKVTALVDQSSSAAGGPMSFWWTTILKSPVLIGIGLIAVVAVLRRIWVGFPFNPIGLVVAVSWPVYVVWGSLMLGWLAKLLILRYGGVALYKRLKPVAIGLILGDVLGYCVQFVATAISRAGGYGLDIWRNPP